MLKRGIFSNDLYQSITKVSALKLFYFQLLQRQLDRAIFLDLISNSTDYFGTLEIFKFYRKEEIQNKQTNPQKKNKTKKQ